MVVTTESVQDQGLGAGVDVMAVEGDEAAEAEGTRRRKKAQTELRGEYVASKEQSAGTVSPAEEAVGKLGGAQRAVKKKKKNKAAVLKKKKNGTCAGTVSTTDEAAGQLGGAGTAVRKKKSARRPEARTEFRGVSRAVNGRYWAKIRHSGIARWLGTFDTVEEAARAYDAAAVELHGSSAVTNFNPSGESFGQATGSVKTKVKKPAAARPDARTEFQGKYKAYIWDSKVKSSVLMGTFGTAVEAATAYDAAAVEVKRSGTGRWLGTFDTAEEAARAYDAAAVELHGASAVTNFKVSRESSVRTVGSVKMKVKKPPPVRPDAQTQFRGVHRLPRGNYSAQIWDSKRKSAVYLGRFGTAEEAARAYDSAAIKRHGVAARTNFEQQPTAAAADDGEVSSMDLPNDYPELPALDFSESLIPGPQMDDLRTDLPPAQWQLVQEFLKDFDEVVD
ncbi:unnamed protein product [Alopecurus aequalis]